MSTTIVVTRNVSDRIRGFLASSMLELAPGLYCAPRISPAVRFRIWNVLSEWFAYEDGASIVMLWADSQKPGGLSLEVLGVPRIGLEEVDGLILSVRS